MNCLKSILWTSSGIFHLEELPEAKEESCDLQICLGPGTGYKGASRPYPRRAIDLTLLDPEGRELPMGCGFDAFTDKTVQRIFEAPGMCGGERTNAGP